MTSKPDEALNKVIACLKNKRSFVLEAGAGSGKTRTLIDSLSYLLSNNGPDILANNQRIVCITYTNVAKDEIKSRIDNHPAVQVNTIHEFLWSIIKHYQRELKQIIQENNINSPKSIEGLDLDSVTIEYSPYGTELLEGRITHDDVILYSLLLFEKFKKIAAIVGSKFPFILVDEYQDTDPRTVQLLVDNILPNSNKPVAIGFFGDSMQQIYDQGVGKIERKNLVKITKEDNFRCSKKVIDLLNHIRSTLQQKPAGDNLDGSVSFYHCNGVRTDETHNYEKVINLLEKKYHWDFEDPKTKILMLTHMGIATRLGYDNLIKAYSNLPFGRDKFFSKTEIFSKIIQDSIEPLVASYEEKDCGTMIPLLGLEGFKISGQQDKIKVDSLLRGLIQIRETGTIEDVLNFAISNKLIARPSKLDEFLSSLEDPDKDAENDFYCELMNVDYCEVIPVCEYIQEKTPFSTKHGVKGTEFDNVLVVIDDGSWFKYNFNEVLANDQRDPDRYEKSQNLFYVCCSRAKNNLAILALSKVSEGSIKTVERWISKENVHSLSDII